MSNEKKFWAILILSVVYLFGIWSYILALKFYRHIFRSVESSYLFYSEGHTLSNISGFLLDHDDVIIFITFILFVLGIFLILGAKTEMDYIRKIACRERWQEQEKLFEKLNEQEKR